MDSPFLPSTEAKNCFTELDESSDEEVLIQNSILLKNMSVQS